MSELKTAIHPKSKKVISFDEELHKYTTEEIKDFTSVTTVIHKFFEEFDAANIAPRVAKKRGISVEAILAEWEENKNKACELGTRIHLLAEMYLEKQKLPDIPKRMVPHADAILEYLPIMLDRYELISTELMVFSEELKLAGQIDLIVREKSTNTLYIMDYKTSKVINKYNRFNKFGKPPISHLDDTNFMHYALQLNLYKYIMQREGYFNEPMELQLIWINKSGVVNIPLPNLDKEIETIIKTL